MPKKAVIAAIGVAVLGALAWALIMWGLEREFFYMAALVGALVGLAAAYFKAQGMTAGIVCAVLTVGAIGGGKVLGFQFAFDGIVLKMTAEETTESEYKAQARCTALRPDNSAVVARAPSTVGARPEAARQLGEL